MAGGSTFSNFANQASSTDKHTLAQLQRALVGRFGIIGRQARRPS